ncbi:MAG: hypothetical protein OMM_05559 [Candidatus Magnetoglobus multicellularis str. Araruama]|uniref:LamG-like jellyroll fold domain-containing protein n=1 Tax=Candidatus Magnetoglobus multicellularis str. Araruama TaxID=890399 RepID=A0A1V1NVM0_9BACT|nr:MAG: hypothetical protein OMM_05559 [Candidatus Magnetoglobus multicellularis str. Araruama]
MTAQTAFNLTIEDSFTIEISDIEDVATASDIPIHLTVAVSENKMITLTALSSDPALLSNMNLGGSGYSGIIETLTANVEKELTLTYDQSATGHGRVTVTVLADSGDHAVTSTFFVLVSPSGSAHALRFDGNQYVNCGDDIYLDNRSFSIEFWMKRTSSGSHDFMIGHGSSGANSSLTIGFRDTNVFNFNFYSNGVATSETYTDTNWHHWAVTYESGTKERKIFRDGVLKGNDISASHYLGIGNFYIGVSDSMNFYSNDLIDELRIWNDVRTQTEIQDSMCKKIAPDESLIAYYRFDHLSGNTLIDLSGNNHHGTLNNMTDSNWILSEAALGDMSAHDYTGTAASDFSVSIAHADGDAFTAAGDSGNYSGIQIYLVNSSPNKLTPPAGYSSIDTDHYYGVYPVGELPTYSIAYNYSGNTYAGDGTDLQMAYRVNNAGDWTGMDSTHHISETSLVKSGISALSHEFTLGKNDAPTIATLFDQFTQKIQRPIQSLLQWQILIMMYSL